MSLARPSASSLTSADADPRRWAGWGSGLLAVIILLGFVAGICAFHLLDRDFWWHVKAGELMVQTKALITTEPFAYTRAGEPYLARHEWLAQIALYLVHHVGGATGVIFLRTLMMAACLLLLLSLDPRRLAVNTLLAILAANAMQPAFLERPQLFTFVLFAAFLRLAVQALEGALTRRTVLLFIGLQVLWVNVHGAASLMGIMVVGAVACQRVWEWVRGSAHSRAERGRELMRMGWLLVGLFAAMAASPNALQNVTYVFQLFGERTIALIGEWQPREWAVYLTELGPLWVLTVVVLGATRHHLVWSLALLGTTGVLSRQAFRHEPLWVLCAMAVIIVQLRWNVRVRRGLEWLGARRLLRGGLYAAAVIGLGFFTRSHYLAFVQRDHLNGYGAFELARGAYNFIEREGIQGRMFNTYGIGGYLLYRGHPKRPVYIDGRNVDYGFALMYQTYLAGRDPLHWKALEDRYQFTYALIDYDAIKQPDALPYLQHLERNPDWVMVYLDDWVAVYLKRVAANQDVIDRRQYAVLTPTALEFGKLAPASEEDTARLEAELRRSIADNPDGVKARLALARRYVTSRRIEEARALLTAARTVQPYRPAIYELTAALAALEGKWPEAAAAYTAMLRYAREAYPDINYGYLSEVFANAGQMRTARAYARRAGRSPPQENPTESTVPSPAESPMPMPTSATQPSPSLLEGLGKMGDDIESYNQQGIQHAEGGRFDEAREAFLTALMLNPSDARTLNNLGALSHQTGQAEEAISYYERALASYPDYAEAHFNLAASLAHLGRHAEALPHAEQAHALGHECAAFIDVLRRRAAPQ